MTAVSKQKKPQTIKFSNRRQQYIPPSQAELQSACAKPVLYLIIGACTTSLPKNVRQFSTAQDLFNRFRRLQKDSMINLSNTSLQIVLEEIINNELDILAKLLENVSCVNCLGRAWTAICQAQAFKEFKKQKIKRGWELSLEEFVKNLDQEQGLQNYQVRTDANNSLFNHKAFVLSLLTKPCTYDEESVRDIQQIFSHIQNNFELTKYKWKPQSIQSTLKMYKLYRGFYQTINVLLRKSSNILVLYLARLFIYCLYESIRLLGEWQLDNFWSPGQELDLTRGCFYNQEEIRELKSKIGQIIVQQGFNSYSLDEKCVLKHFAKNTIVKCTVYTDQYRKKGIRSPGFVYTEGIENLNEQEVLINIMNNAEILSIEELDKRKARNRFGKSGEKIRYIISIRLHPTQVSKQKIEDENTQNMVARLIASNVYHEQLSDKIKTQGDVFFYRHEMEKCREFYQNVLGSERILTEDEKIHIYIRVGESYFYTSRFTTALSYFRQIYKRVGKKYSQSHNVFKRLCYLMAICCKHLRQYDDARVWVTLALRRDQDCDWALKNEARLLLKQIQISLEEGDVNILEEQKNGIINEISNAQNSSWMYKYFAGTCDGFADLERQYSKVKKQQRQLPLVISGLRNVFDKLKQRSFQSHPLFIQVFTELCEAHNKQGEFWHTINLIEEYLIITQSLDLQVLQNRQHMHEIAADLGFIAIISQKTPSCAPFGVLSFVKLYLALGGQMQNYLQVTNIVMNNYPKQAEQQFMAYLNLVQDQNQSVSNLQILHTYDKMMTQLYIQLKNEDSNHLIQTDQLFLFADQYRNKQIDQAFSAFLEYLTKIRPNMGNRK